MAVQNTVLGAVVAVVMLFVGIFMVSEVAGVTPEDQLLDYTYTTVTNSTDLTGLNSSDQDHGISIGVFADEIENKDYNHELTSNVTNSDSAEHTVNVSVEGTQVGQITVPASDSAEKTFEDISYTENATNTITYSSGVSSDVLTVKYSEGDYASGQEDSDFGSIQSTLIDNTSTVYSILVLALIIIVLAIAIQYLRVFGTGRTTTMQ